MAQIRVENVRKEFGAFTAVQSASFTMEDGEFFMLRGPSERDKITTLRMMAGLELPTSDEIYKDGEKVAQMPASQRDIAFVLQMFALYQHVKHAQECKLPAESSGHAARRGPAPRKRDRTLSEHRRLIEPPRWWPVWR